MTTSENGIVDNTEMLYRSVKANNKAGNAYRYVNGKLKISSTAFNDRYWQPSVDRAKYYDHNPKKAIEKFEPGGVLFLHTHQVRGEKVPHSEHISTLDVKADPNPVNESHAVIVGKPTYRSDDHFKKAKERLAILAEKNGWCLEPQE